ncbi:MAG TPA: hypothetical protein VN132_10470, partial [Bdellovibrio sp.]|nr:hypothetical protein [Bdellovibrio sp.]
MNILKFIMLATVAFTGAARASENVNVPAIQINVTSSDGNPVSNAFVTLELWADSWGFYTGNGEPLPTHLGWHSTMKFHNSIAANSSSFVVPAFSGSYRNPNYMVRVEGLAV